MFVRAALRVMRRNLGPSAQLSIRGSWEVRMLGALGLDAAFVGIMLLEAGFVVWLMGRSRRERDGGLVDDAVRLGLRASRRRA